MTMHPGDFWHRWKGHPKKPKPPKCRACLRVTDRSDLVRVGGSRYHPDCVSKRRTLR